MEAFRDKRERVRERVEEREKYGKVLAWETKEQSVNVFFCSFGVTQFSFSKTKEALSNDVVTHILAISSSSFLFP